MIVPADSSSPIVVLEEVHKYYRLGHTSVHAVKGVSLKLYPGQMVCIMGPSGSGKSTILNLVGCLDRPDQGRILVEDRDLAGCNRAQLADIRAHSIGYIFQAFNLIPVLNVYENVEFPLNIRKTRLTRQRRHERVTAVIEAVGLADQIRQRPDELSGGQRQRVAIARALVTEPRLVLADEPTANLDSETAGMIIELMTTLNRDRGVTFLFSTHDHSITQYAPGAWQLRDGRIVHRRGTAG